MTPIATMVEKMLAAGLSADMITLAVNTAEECLRATVSAEIPRTKADISAERRRAADRERKAAVRRIPQNSADIPRTEMSASTLEVGEVIKKEERVEAGNGSSADIPQTPKRIGSRLPADWEPTEADVAFAREHGRDDETIRVEAIKFRNHWLAKTGRDATKLDWSRTWQNWILNARTSNGQHRFGDLRADPAAGNGSAGYDPVVAGVARVAARRMRTHDEREARNSSQPRAGPGAAGLNFELHRKT
jgi:hypothetical protein